MAVREFRLPDLGEGLEEAEIVTWRVSEGDPVELNQALVEVNTAKALVEIPAPWEGVVEKLHGPEGAVVKVGEPLISIRIEDEADVQPEGRAAAPEDVPPAEVADTPRGDPADVAHTAQQAAQERGGDDARQATTETDRQAEGTGTAPKRRAVLVGYGVSDADEPVFMPGGVGAVPREGAPERGGPVPASPPVRRMARDMGVDLASVAGTGPGGRVTREDVARAARSDGPPRPEEAPGAGDRPAASRPDREVVPVRGTRRLIAEKMSRSVREIPHVTTFLTVDATQVMALRDEIAAESGERVSPLPIVIRALAEVCRRHPDVNASFSREEGAIVRYRDCHVGIATDTERGLVVTVVRDAGRKGILEIARDVHRLADVARGGTAKPDELSGGTITVTNVGSFGAEFGTPIINHPEAAILALGVIGPRALVVDGRVEPRPAVTLSLSFDHRVLDGAEAGRALKTLGGILESPFKLGALPR
jgi:2-oxoisovalerate dehydrogenase E2 component (dihydrolipoyl transacylase)